ncbi:MAG: GNAT family N-acetyltransferase [Actinobacteria bacterium]|nr:GNAT family N-acetyltransferase [Actinomycetota bacterium]MBU1492999.1 GNAT family N-acetyltransferase [Actinomycetota bacterium]
MTVGARRAVPGDAIAIATVQVASWNATYRGLMPDEAIDRMTVETRAPRWVDIIEAGHVVFVAVEDGRVVGFCSVAESADEPDTGEITAMYADPNVLGRGHGHRLMGEAIGWFTARGFHAATLWVLATNHIGRTFYEKAGWRPDGVESDHEVFGMSHHHARFRIDL